MNHKREVYRSLNIVRYYLNNFLEFDKLNRYLWTSYVIINLGCKLFKLASLVILYVVYETNLHPKIQLEFIKQSLKEEDNGFTKKLFL